MNQEMTKSLRYGFFLRINALFFVKKGYCKSLLIQIKSHRTQSLFN